MDHTEWREMGMLQIDSATCAFGNAEDVHDWIDDPEASPGLEGCVEDWTGTGHALIACNTREDFPLPVEISVGGDGRAVAARLTFTTDVDELEASCVGRWLPAGELRLSSGRGMAADPFCAPVAAYRVPFDTTPGLYSAEVFDTGRDCLGLRIRLQATSEEEART